ncbi:alpha-1,2-mannosidase, putative [Pedobacter steynii]|uniref:Alpha-1,2-mannosidase, putative n=1 Tax=Pedobacter steynii TaxID=430522 RepID=A0A1G9UVA8_9SPHI|nr:glycoside hydrolase domain-containing protein [Pedobacter steynii]NQX40882.1 glycoside hydrolase family 92 protein [Pedobacter steynii]SDM63565.1 alpha-1,2-mannosidase, putative [Pedobacter steynii]
MNIKNNLILLIIALFCSYSSLYAQKVGKYVNLFMGTSGDNGQVDPAACVPYGMVRVCPDSKPRSHSGYDFAVDSISGFSVNRLSGIGCGGNGGNLSIKPCSKDSALKILKTTEYASPGYYKTGLTNGLTTEFTATQQVAVERYHYPKGREALMTLNVASAFNSVYDASYEIVSARTVRGYVWAGTTCDVGRYKIYFDLTTNRDFKKVSGTKKILEFSFGTADGRPLEVRIALSPIDTKTAAMENDRLSKLNFNKVKSQAAAQWENLLGRVKISGGTDEHRSLFYTSLYRVFLSPVNTTSGDQRFFATNGTVQEAKDFTYYSSWSMWDSYRTKFPLITLLDPKSMKGICKSLSRLYVYGKQPWATAFESTPTVRTEHTVSVLLDAYRKGITDIDLPLAYPGLKREADSLETKRPDQILEASIDLWAMGKIAEIERNPADAAKYGAQSKKLFDNVWDLYLKNVDGSFGKMRSSGLYQGTKWQYRWALPQYLDRMASTSEGKLTLGKELAYYFDHQFYNQGNEVGIHAPFIFNRLGRPDLAQKTVTSLLTKEIKHLYGGNSEYASPIYSKIFKNDPVGFLPEMDEDDGTMSGWYTFAAMGLFPLVVGEPSYEITSPLFENIEIRPGNGEKIKIKVINRHSLDDQIKSISFNGDQIKDFRIDHNELIKGGELCLEY